jgi:response regulator of citrate/malate metabolism
MKLTAEDVAKATKLSLTTVRVYAAQRKIETKVWQQQILHKGGSEEVYGSGRITPGTGKA